MNASRNPATDALVVTDPNGIHFGGHHYKAGEKVGELRAGRPVPGVPGADLGLLQAALNLKRIDTQTNVRTQRVAREQQRQARQAEGPAKEAHQPEPPKAPYPEWTVTALLGEVNRRRQEGRNVTVASARKADLVAALEADDRGEQTNGSEQEPFDDSSEPASDESAGQA